ncbi:hypothetical protein EW026_g7755 [Hermanssonia centrifuga]|uniref:F-box domain-containing protein n=1 Tax=Hermanssonia centrifuga TaxID=98765 RepID=A0A4S4K6R5_9APHY|nr:hypothetical protein EW026_g7755 [Hermanssonia centrifuga]
MLPFELVDKIIREASSNHSSATLRACALVCETWRAAARPYIFRKIKILDESQLATLETLIGTDPAVGVLIRELIIQPRTEQERTPSRWISRFPAVLPPHLNRLQTIQLVDLFDFGEYCNPDFFSAFSAFASVDQLILHHCALNLRLVYSCVSALPNIRHLHVGTMLPVPYILPDAPPQLHAPKLLSIKLNVGSMYPMALEEILEWMLGSSSKDYLRSASLTTRIVNATAVGNFIDELGGLLQHLELDFVRFSASEIEYDIMKADISLAKCTALRSLSFRGCNPTLPAFLAFLSEINSPYIRKLSLWATSSGADRAILPDFRVLVEQLDSRHLRGLEEVCFTYRGPLQRAFVLEKLQRDLPNVDSRGILRLVMT